MNRILLENMFKIIEENDFEINREINGDCVCTICHKIMADACNVPCGCRYCKKCITEYLRNNDRECPGQTEYCKSQLINIDTDICKDHAINIKISKIIVKCPNISCELKLELRLIENHMRICDKRSHFCPFTNIGCAKILCSNKLDEHLANDTHSHNQLLMDWINTTMNDMELMRNNFAKLTLENMDLRNKIKSTEEQNEAKAEMQEHIIEDMKNTQQILLFKIEEQSRLMNDMELMKNNFAKLTLENIDLKNKIKSTENQNKILLVKIEEQGILLDQLKQNQKKSNQDNESRLDKLVLENHSIKESIVETRFGEFVWIIDKWSEKLKQAQNGINETIYSEEFFSHRNGYKMIVVFRPNGFDIGKDNYLSISFCIKKGPFDNSLQWPFKYDVESAIINQSTGFPHQMHVVEYNEKMTDVYNRPINEKNTPYGIPQFIKISEISNNAVLSLNDQIIIKCRVELI